MKIVLLENLGVKQEIIQEHSKKLEKLGHELICYEKDTNEKVQIDRIKDADAIILANMPLKKEVIKQANHLKFIDVAFTGVDHIPMQLAKEKGIIVSNASGYATQAVAELCIGFAIQLLRHISQTEQRCKEGKTKEGLIGHLLHGKTVGIVGAGAIGKKTAALFKAFGCRILACHPRKIDDSMIDEQVSLQELMCRCDIISLHCPLKEETKHLIGMKELMLMKSTAVLINTARGGVINTQALAQVLHDKKIAGAALDVFDMEPPLPLDYPLLHTPNTIVTPHIAFASVESLEQRVAIVFNNLYAFLEGNPINCM